MSRRRSRVLVTAVGGVFAAIGAVALGVAVVGQEPPPPSVPRAVQTDTEETPSAPETEPTADPSAQPSDQSSSQPSEAPAERASEGLEWSRPVRVTIPEIDASSTLVEIGLDEQGVMEVPQDPDKAGWFTPLPPPGVAGVSVIAGHVTWNQEPVVFFRLADLRKGDRIEVERADGVTAIFEVTRIGEFPKNQFPTEAVYQHVDHPSLRLITCGGGYDEVNNRYLSNVIVWAELVDSERA